MNSALVTLGILLTMAWIEAAYEWHSNYVTKYNRFFLRLAGLAVLTALFAWRAWFF